MRERPIIFSGPLVRALLAGTKTQTRRIAPITDLSIRPHDNEIVSWSVRFSKPIKGVLSSHSGGRLTEEQARRIIASKFCPYGQPGDRLWVREAHAIVPRTAYARSEGVEQVLRPDDDHDACVFREGWERSRPGRWRPSIHMPRWAGRILLEITGVRVERLQDISEADAEAEGIAPQPHHAGRWLSEHRPAISFPSPVAAFSDLWESINGPGSWDANPWVWAVEFRRVDGAKEASE